MEANNHGYHKKKSYPQWRDMATQLYSICSIHFHGGKSC